LNAAFVDEGEMLFNMGGADVIIGDENTIKKHAVDRPASVCSLLLPHSSVVFMYLK
jgi:hypothetical protein